MKTIHLPFAEAVQLEAKQNYERDKWQMTEDGEDMPPFSVYLEEAEEVLKLYDQGYVPEHCQHYHVFVKV